MPSKSFRRRTPRYRYRRTYRRRLLTGYRRRYIRRRTRVFKRRARWYSRKYNYKDKFLAYQFQLRPNNTAGLITYGFALRPVQITNWASRHILYDQAKIYKWKLTVVPPVSQIGAYQELESVGPRGLSSCRHYLAYDYTDDTPPASPGLMLNSTSSISTSWDRPLKMIIRPKLSKLAYETGTTTGNAYMPSTGWIDVDDENTPHYGFKYLMDNTSYTATAETTPYLQYNIYYTVYYGFKNTQKPGLT